MATLLSKLSSKRYKGQNKDSSTSTRSSRYPWAQRKLRNSQRTLPRYGHATISHPKYGLIVYGGKHKGHAKKELFAINPATLTTSIIPSIGDPPSQRLYSGLASFDNFIVLYGGEPLTLDQTWDPNVYILNLNTNRWTRSPSNQRVGERSGHSMLASRSKFYIWGGKRSTQTFLNDMCVFQVRNGKNGGWERITFLSGTAPLPRSNHCSVLFEEKIYIFGGGNKQQLFNDVWVYDIQQNSWECITTSGFIPSRRHYCSACLVNGVMYVHGGKDELGQDLHELYGFKIKNRCWYMFQNMGRAPSARFGHTMTPVGSKLYVIGGDNVNPTTKGDDPLTIHILDNDKVSYPPDEATSPTNTISTNLSQRRTSSPILPPGDRPPSVSPSTTKTDIICQVSESTPVTSLTLGSIGHLTSSRSTPIPQATPSRSSSFQATPLVSPTCSAKVDMDYDNEKALLLQEIKSRDRTISEMKNKEHWWRTQVAKARGIGDESMGTATDLEQQLDLMCFSDDDDENGRGDVDNIPETKRLLFERLVMAKAEARYIKRDIQAISKSVSRKLDNEDRIRKSALDEANHYKALCAALLHQGESIAETPGHHFYGIDTDPLDGLDLYRAEQRKRVTHLQTNLDKVLQDNLAMEKELATLQDEAQTNEQQRFMVAKQLEDEHARAQQAQEAYGTTLKRLYFLQKRTHLDEQKYKVNQHHISLLEEQLQYAQRQSNKQQELHQNVNVNRDGNLPALIGQEEDTIRQWELRNREQQETITLLKQQLTHATDAVRSLHADLKKTTCDWSTVITSLKLTKLEIESLVT